MKRPGIRQLLRWGLPALAMVVSLGFPSAGSGLRIGDPAPAFGLSDLAGDRVVVPGDLQGRVVALHYWASWCPSCVEEMKALDELAGALGERGFVPLSVNVGEERRVVEPYVRSLGLKYRVLLDSNSAVARNYGVSGLPMTFILDRGGMIRYKIVGEVNREGLRRLVMTVR